MVDLSPVDDEIWANKRTGKIVFVFERNKTYVRMHENFHDDMGKRKFSQMPFNLFNKTYKFIGLVTRKRS